MKMISVLACLFGGLSSVINKIKDSDSLWETNFIYFEDT